MGEKEAGKNEGEKKVDDGKKDAIVLKIDLHCEGCAKKVKRLIRNIDGVEEVKGDFSSGKLTVTGNVDPSKLREKVEEKTKKKVEVISPAPKKDGGEKKSEEKKPEKPAEEKKTEEKKPKETPVTTVVLKTRLHCEGCIQKIYKIVGKFKGVQKVAIDGTKDLVTVTGTMDVKELTAYLTEKFKRSVEVVPAKKDAAAGGGGDKKDKDAGGEKKEGGGEKKEVEAKSGGGDGAKKEEAPAIKVEANKMEYHGYPHQTYQQVYPYQTYQQGYGYGYDGQHGYGNGPEGQVPYGPSYVVDNHHAPQYFSDENPNACSVM